MGLGYTSAKDLFFTSIGGGHYLCMMTIREGGSQLIDLNAELDMRALQAHYHTLPLDPYVPQGFRAKQLVRCRVSGERIIEQPHGPLFQSGQLNPVHGDLIRDYARFPRLDLVSEAVRRFAALCGVDAGYEVLVQPHRITCRAGSPGEPAVEGFHRDGIDYMAILCVAREGIVGGETQLVRELGGEVALRRTLQVGEMLLVDDRAWYHYTSSIHAAPGCAEGYRDVLLLSASPGFVNRPPVASYARAA